MNNVLKKALTAADVGVAIGSGSAFPYSFRKSSYISFSIGDVALSSASFILVSSNLQSLLTLTDLSETVFNRVKFNFVCAPTRHLKSSNFDIFKQLWASIYNLIAIPIAAGVVYPAGHARLAPVWASLSMALS